LLTAPSAPEAYIDSQVPAQSRFTGAQSLSQARRASLLWLSPVLYLLLVVSARAEYSIPASNRIDWYSYVGVPGGIPYYSDIHTDLTGTIDATGVDNEITDIQNAINAADTAGWAKVVVLPAGTIRVQGTLHMKNGVVLRGTGTNTLINIQGTVSFSDGGGWVSKSVLATSSTNGSTNIFTTASVGSDIVNGSVVWIDQLNDTTFVFAEGWELDSPATCGYCDDPVNTGARVMGQSFTVKSVSNGTNITFYPPLVWDWSNTPQIRYRATLSGTNNARTWAGLENLKFNNQLSPNNNIVNMTGAAWCWVSNCWFTIHGNEVAAILLQNAHQNKIVHNWADNGNGNTDAMFLYEFIRNGFNHIENNIGYHIKSFLFASGVNCGSTWTYNSLVINTNASTQLVGDYYHHGGHPIFALREGNYGWRILYDSIHGTGSHITTWRNWMRGRDTWTTYGMGCYWNDSTNWFGHFIGNVAWYRGVAQNAPTAFNAVNTTFRWGYSGYNDIPDSVNKAKNTVHGFYDFLSGTNAVVYKPGEDATIPASAIYTNKPAWFGILPWPPFAMEGIPADTNSIQLTNSPSGYRFVYATDPPADGEGEPEPPPAGVYPKGRATGRIKSAGRITFK
jgi:hypothetical protein